MPRARGRCAGHRWKLVRTFDDPTTWTEPGARHLADSGPGGPAHRTEPLEDQWELYDLDVDPIEVVNRWHDPGAAAVVAHLRDVLKAEAARCVLVVDVASPAGGVVPVDPQSLKPVLRCPADDRFLADPELRSKVGDSLAVADVDVADYDLVYLAGGWGAAFDFGTSRALADQLSRANELGLPIGGVCHGPLGLRNATGPDGRPLVEGRRISCVTDKQVQELGIASTPMHPETELRAVGARFEAQHRFRDPLANHWVVDGNLVTDPDRLAAQAAHRVSAIADTYTMILRPTIDRLADSVAEVG